MPSTRTLGSTLPAGPKSLQVKCQAFLHDGSRGLKWPAPASHLSQITIMGLEPRVQLDVQVGLRISWLTQGLPTLS